MNAFDKVCAAMAFLLGIVLLILGVFGLLAGCKAHFSLPPLLGVLPAFVGWGIIRAVSVAWRRPPSDPMWQADLRDEQSGQHGLP